MVRGRGVLGSRSTRRLVDETEFDAPMSTDEVVSSTPTSTSTPQGSTSATQSIVHASEGAKTRVHLVGDVLHSDPISIATGLREIIESRVHLLGHTYAAMPSSHTQLWWLEFQRRYDWDETMFSTTAIYSAFVSATRRRYSSETSEWRQLWEAKKTKSACVPDEYWAAWQTKWDKTEFKTKSEKYRANRLIEPKGTWISKHIGGSRSTIDHTIDILSITI